MNRGEAAHLAKIHELPCCLCGQSPVEAHHLSDIVFGDRDECHYLVIPACSSCHRGPQGIHGDRTMLRVSKKSELWHLGQTLRKLYGSR